MGEQNHFKIAHKGLKLGKHNFDFSINDSFFEQIDYSEIKKANVHIHIDLEKNSQMMICEIELSGTVNVECDRCLDPFDLPIQYIGNLYIKYGESEQEDTDDEILIISPEEDEIDLMHLFYEYISLSIPVRHVHLLDSEGNSLCNKEMIKYLEEYIVEDEGETESDPRWDKLKELLN